MGVEWRAGARGGGGGGGWLPFADREIGRSGAVLIWVSQSVVHEVYMIHEVRGLSIPRWRGMACLRGGEHGRWKGPQTVCESLSYFRP